MIELDAPFSWFGGKSRIADEVWARFGDVKNYIEPFMGSAAVLLRRPTPPQVETANDVNCYIANFWRAVARNPDEVARHADWPVSEADLEARHRYLIGIGSSLRDRITSDPEDCDPKAAGWWVWGQSQWIGAGWCDGTRCRIKRPRMYAGEGGSGVSHRVPRLGTNGHGGTGVFRRQIPHLSSAGGGGVVGGPSDDIDAKREWLVDWMRRLQSRMARVRICCGDWSRVCSSPSTTTRIGITGVFLDPPYCHDTGRDTEVYGGHDDGVVAAKARSWARKAGRDPMMRIALCGYAEEHGSLEEEGWSVFSWTAKGGYGNRSDGKNTNRFRERVWFSPACLDPTQALFQAAADNVRIASGGGDPVSPVM